MHIRAEAVEPRIEILELGESECKIFHLLEGSSHQGLERFRDPAFLQELLERLRGQL